MTYAPDSSGPEVQFSGSIPLLYEQHMVPLIFEPYANDLATRVAARRPARVLEIAAGTGVATRALARALPVEVVIVATDLSQQMLDLASSIGTARPVEWRQADALHLPFADASFDVVACQFGVMFLPDKVLAYAEARRVLRPGGALVFNAWDRIEYNEFTHVVSEALRRMFPDDPPLFMERLPHGYFDVELMRDQLVRAGFDRSIEITTLGFRSRAATSRIPAVALCQGTPWRTEIEARDPARLSEATDVADAALAARFGPGPVDGRIQAIVVCAER